MDIATAFTLWGPNSGMIGVTLFGLIFTPVFYVVTRWIALRFQRKKDHEEPVKT